MNEIEIINKLQEVFTPVAQKIGEGAEFGWDVVMRQQIITGIQNLILAFFGIILGIVVYKVVKYSIERNKEDSWGSWDFIGAMVGTFGGITSLSMIIFGILEGMAYLINPAYYAIQFFMGLVK